MVSANGAPTGSPAMAATVERGASYPVHRVQVYLTVECVGLANFLFIFLLLKETLVPIRTIRFSGWKNVLGDNFDAIYYNVHIYGLSLNRNCYNRSTPPRIEKRACIYSRIGI